MDQGWCLPDTPWTVVPDPLIPGSLMPWLPDQPLVMPIQRAWVESGSCIFSNIPKCFCCWWFLVYIFRNPFLGQSLYFTAKQKKAESGKALTGSGGWFQAHPSQTPGSARTEDRGPKAWVDLLPDIATQLLRFPRLLLLVQLELLSGGIWVSCGCSSQLPQTRGLTPIEMYSPTVLEARSPNSAGPHSLWRL